MGFSSNMNLFQSGIFHGKDSAEPGLEMVIRSCDRDCSRILAWF